MDPANLVPKRVLVSPETARILQSGHPWILKDAFTEKFPKKHKLLMAITQNHRGQEVEIGTFLHDPSHPLIKGRLWSLASRPQTQGIKQAPSRLGTTAPHAQATHSFSEELRERLSKAMAKRFESNLLAERENFYLVFGEGDALPGLFIQLQKEHVLLQLYSSFWQGPFEEWILQHVESGLTQYLPGKKFTYWLQERGSQAPFVHRPFSPSKGQSATPVAQAVIEEFGLKYRLDFSGYDFGLYTDMAALRKQLIPYLKPSGRALNLFSYTGAFSLLCLKQEMQVTSVDLSAKNMEWLEHNIALNPQLSRQSHRGLVLSAEVALKKLAKEGERFDLIICDPPTLSTLSHGQRRQQSALNLYETLLPLMVDRLLPQGHLLIFLNTHKVKAARFIKKVEEILSRAKSREMVIEKTWHLAEDCPRLKNFPEGDYLKGLLMHKKGTGPHKKAR